MGVIDKTKIRNILIAIFLVLFSRVFWPVYFSLLSISKLYY